MLKMPGPLSEDMLRQQKDSENGLPEKYSYDGVHLTTEGYDVIEAMILKVLK